MPEIVKSEGKKREDLSFGQIAIREQFVSPDRILECLEIQRKLQDLDLESKKIGEILIQKGYLTRDQAGRIVEIQVGKNQSAKPRTSRVPKKPPAIPGYEILGLLGRGANGTVYRARQVSMDRMVAIKILARKQGTDKAFVERFIREAQVVAKLNHENIILGIDVGESQGLHYFVMEFVDGEPVSAILKREGRLDEKRSIQIALPILKALSHAREHGLVHRDVKPENIMMAQNDVAKLCDLGLAKQTQEDGGDLTREGISVGTPNYISPEQARGESEIDIRSDIYSLGASLYHMVTGSPVFTGLNPMVIMTKHVTDKPDPPMKRFPGISAGLNAVIMKMIQKRREDRYQMPEDVMKDLEAVLLGQTPSALAATGKVTRRVQVKSEISPAIRTRRRQVKKSVPPAVPILAVLGIAVVAGILLISSMGKGKSEPGPNKPSKDTTEVPRNPEKPLKSAMQKFEEDGETFRSYWKDKILRMESGWVQAIYIRGEEYLRQYEREPTELKMVDLVRKSRDEVNRLILERGWNDLHAKAEQAVKKGAYAEAIETTESMKNEHIYFQSEPKKVLTQAGDRQQKYLKDLLDVELPRAYLSDRKAVAAAKGIQAYNLIERMFEKYGERKRPDLVLLRKSRLAKDMKGFLSDPFTGKKREEAAALLAALEKKWTGTSSFQADLRREEEALKKRKEQWISDSGKLAKSLYESTFLPPFEAALSQRDLSAARALLHEVYFGKTYAPAWPSIFVGQVDRTLLGKALNPHRVAPIDYSASVKAIEKVAREAMGNQKPAAVDYYFSLRSYLLMESFFESAFRGVPLQNGDSRKFGRYSTMIKNSREAEVIVRKAGLPWKIRITRRMTGGGTEEKEIYLAPKGVPPLLEGDLVLLVKRANLKTWKTDPYFFLKVGLLYLYAGMATEARDWLGGVTGADAGFEINRLLDRVKESPSGNLEETARTKFKQASKLIARESKRALGLCHELRDQYARTDWMTTLVDEKGRKMKKSRLEVVLLWIDRLENKAGKSGKKEKDKQGIFRGDVRFKGNRMEAVYDFSKEGLEADFTPSWWQERLNVEQKREGIRLWGRGTWYWKAPMIGDVTIEIDVIANADQAIGGVLHGEGYDRGYVAIADMEGGGSWQPLEGQSILYKQPITARTWRERYLSGGAKSVSFRNGRSYKLRFERKGDQLTLYVGNIRAVSAKDAEYQDGKIGITLSHSDIIVKKLRVIGQIDEDWLSEEEERLEK